MQTSKSAKNLARAAAVFTAAILTVGTSVAQEFEMNLLNKGVFFAVASILEDVDGDGDLDVVLVRRDAVGFPAGLEWLENDGTGQFPRRPLFDDDSLIRPNDVDVCDCDGDGDTDYVISDRGSGAGTGQLIWIQREDDGSFIKWTIEAGAEFGQSAVADFDDDGDDDVVSVGFTQTTLNLYLNDGNLNFSEETLADNIVQSTLVEAEDIDEDGDVDIVFNGGNRILWNNGDATFTDGPQLFTWNDLTPSSAFGLTVVDLNGDGVRDVLTFSGIGTGGLYFLNGANNFDQTRLHAIGIDLGGDIVVDDFDDNGRLDIIRQEMGDGMLSILYQVDSMQFRHEVLEYKWDNRGQSQLSVGDLDADGDPDLIFPENGNVDGDVSWYENIDGTLFRHQLHSQLKGVRSPKIVDLDGDGDLDVLAALTEDIAIEDEIIWFENRGADGFIDWRISDSVNYPIDVEAADLDGDERLDIIATARDDNDLLWFTGSDGSWVSEKIEDNPNAPLGTSYGDFDGDGDIDVALASSADDKVYWYDNDGNADFTRRIIDANLPDPLDVEGADLDGDGDLDFVVTSTNESNPAVLYINDGEETFTREIIPLDFIPSGLEVGDWTGDGAADIVLATEVNAPDSADVYALVNDGAASFSEEVLLSDNRNVTAIRLADMDGDGTPDLLVGNDNARPRLRVYLNDNGTASLWSELLDDTEATISGIDAADVDDDGMMDIIASDDRSANLIFFRGTGDGGVAVEPIPSELPEMFALEQNYPNPFNPVTTIGFSLPEPEHVSIKIYDLQGREVATLVQGSFAAGRYETEWDATGFASGVYAYRMEAGSHSELKLLILMK